MAPSKGNKVEINPWGWVQKVSSDEINLEHMLKAYRVAGYKRCDDSRRNCKKNPYCYWGLGEKKWIQEDNEEADENDSEFREEGEFAGLQNLGATCYVNSLLQLWFHNPILRPAILRWQPSRAVEDIENYRPKCAIAQLQAMFARMKISKRSKIDPTEFVTSLKLDTGEQQDAQEFSKLFMEVIVKLLTEYVDAEVRTSVGTAFRGELQNETECMGCNNKTQRQESFSELELGVRKNLSESLDELLKDELLSGSEQYFCSMCQKKNDAIRRTQLLKLPPVMNLQLMRFVFDRETLRKKKVTTNIQFPEELDMTSRLYGNDDKETPEKLIYQLSAVLVHNGPSASSGHYVAQIKDLRTGIWLKFNDETVDRVGKAKSQKLVLKEDEGSESDSEKKGKTKKLKSGIHNSQGAYMLVYTLDHYVKNPEPDPDMWPYLENLVKTEDLSYEEEIKKSKNDKDYENSIKEQRRSQISMLYKIDDKRKKSESPEPVEENGEDDEDFQPPRSKICRTEVNSSVKCNSIPPRKSTTTVEKKSSQGKISESSKLENGNKAISECVVPSSTVEIEEEVAVTSVPKVNGEATITNGKISVQHDLNIDFISSDWLTQWLDSNMPLNPVPPVENGMLRCEHEKLAPPAPGTTACLYRIVPSEFADHLYTSYDLDGPRFKGVESLCELCVKRECRRLRSLLELEDDHKFFLDLSKKLDTKIQPHIKNGTNIPPPLLADTCWIGKTTFKNWKKIAKKHIEEQHKSKPEKGDTQIDDETPDIICEDSDDSEWPINAAVKCSHDNLKPDESARKLLPYEAWTIILKYFSDAVLVFAENSSSCIQCLNEKEANVELVKKNRELAANQKSNLTDLFSNSRNRPDIDTVGCIYVIPLNFVHQWRKFVRDPSRHQPVTNIENKRLLCQHEKFMYPLMFLADLYPPSKDLSPDQEVLCLVNDVEWTYIKETFEVDVEISIEVIEPSSKDGLRYVPDVCGECAFEWWISEYRKRFEYENEPIYVIRRDRDNPDNLSDENEDDLFEPIPAKREKVKTNPNAWRDNPQWLKDKDKESQNQGVRRSNRPRRQRGEKTYKVSSDLTLKDLKVMILRDFKAMPSDQHLFHNKVELHDITQTLGTLEILPGSKIYLEVDTATKTEDEPVSLIPETGFQGTLLMGDGAAYDDFQVQEEATMPVLPPSD